MMTGEVAPEAVSDAVRAALAEDRAQSDATSTAVVPPDARAQAVMRARAAGVLSGVEYAVEAFRACDPQARIEVAHRDGDALDAGATVIRVEGSARGILAAERTALNFVQQLSGVATAAAAAARAAGPRLQVLDTRKTVPGLRDAQKAAVRHGGAGNQRRDLAAELLLKENHFALSGLEYAETVRAAVTAAEGRPVGVEAESLEEARTALAGGADYVLLDDFAPVALAGAVAELRAEFPDAVLEASGGVTVERLSQVAASGVDRVSIGALTHSAPALDLALEVHPLSTEGPGA